MISSIDLFIKFMITAKKVSMFDHLVQETRLSYLEQHLINPIFMILDVHMMRFIETYTIKINHCILDYKTIQLLIDL